tara:strand:- start:1353 stop:1805 length:453 start_codon:yes stop_codon:yes gene_type:complete
MSSAVGLWRFVRVAGEALFPVQFTDVFQHHVLQLCLNRLPGFPRFDMGGELLEQLMVQMNQWTEAHLLYAEGQVLVAVCHLVSHPVKTRALWEEAKAHGVRVWKRLRWAVRVRPYALHWIEEHARVHYGPHGEGRKRDRAAFEAFGHASA